MFQHYQSTVLGTGNGGEESVRSPTASAGATLEGLDTGQGAIRAQASEHGPITNNRAPKMRRTV